jgi:hypothetical protein
MAWRNPSSGSARESKAGAAPFAQQLRPSLDRTIRGYLLSLFSISPRRKVLFLRLEFPKTGLHRWMVQNRRPVAFPVRTGAKRPILLIATQNAE